MRTSAVILATLVLSGCNNDEATTPQAVQPSAPSTSFIAFATAGGARKLYVPSRSTADRVELAVVNAASPQGGAAVLRYLDLGAGASPYAVGADGDEVVAVDGYSPTVWFISASTDTVRATASLPAGTQQFWVSGQSFYSAGVAVDAARRRAWVSASTGIVEFDLDAHAVTASYPAPPPENFAYDPVARRLIAPFYLCDPVQSIATCVPYAQPGGPDVTDSLFVIDLAAGAETYTARDPQAADPHVPFGLRPDGVAHDGRSNLVFVTIESPPVLAALDLGQTTYDQPTLSCRIPARAVLGLPAGEWGVVTVDPNTQLALIAEETEGGVALVDVSNAAAGTMPALFFGMPALPTGEPWSTREDPHGVAVGVIDGRPYAFLSDFSREWVARIDLQAMAEQGVAGSSTAVVSSVSYLRVPAPP